MVLVAIVLSLSPLSAVCNYGFSKHFKSVCTSPCPLHFPATSRTRGTATFLTKFQVKQVVLVPLAAMALRVCEGGRGM